MVVVLFDSVENSSDGEVSLEIRGNVEDNMPYSSRRRMPTILEEFLVLPSEGEVGIEIELEAVSSLPTGNRIPSQWGAVGDGSLRGNAVEYVLKSPCLREEVPTLVTGLKKSLKDCGTKTNYSFRAGVHVHINVQKLTVDQMINFACVYYCLESVLMNFCGESRKGNHFCLRAKDAEYPIYLLHEISKGSDTSILTNESIKYAALNFNSLSRFGSLEFRAMETRPDLSKIVDWVDILLRVKDFALKLNSRRDIAYEISYLGPENWAKSVLGDEHYEKLDHPRLASELMSDMRRVQAILYEPEFKVDTQTTSPTESGLAMEIGQ